VSTNSGQAQPTLTDQNQLKCITFPRNHEIHTMAALIFDMDGTLVDSADLLSCYTDTPFVESIGNYIYRRSVAVLLIGLCRADITEPSH